MSNKKVIYIKGECVYLNKNIDGKCRFVEGTDIRKKEPLNISKSLIYETDEMQGADLISFKELFDHQFLDSDKEYVEFIHDVLKMRSILKELRIRYPDAVCSLDFIDPLELMVSTQLSAQCTDKRVNIVTKDLFKKYKGVDDYADADIKELENDIRSTGLYKNKAKNIKSMAKKLRSEYQNRFPDDLSELMKFDGVGRKTGNLFLSVVYKIPGIVVDTHVKRISKRLGFTDEVDPEKIEYRLNNITEVKNWIDLGHLFISFGREICDAKKPRCDICGFKDICRFFLEKK